MRLLLSLLGAVLLIHFFDYVLEAMHLFSLPISISNPSN